MSACLHIPAPLGQDGPGVSPPFLVSSTYTKAQRSRRAKPCGSSSDATARPRTTQATFWVAIFLTSMNCILDIEDTCNM